MNEVDRLKNIINTSESIESYDSADKIIEAYHRLHELKYDDIDAFIFEYARAGLKNEYLKYVFDTHLLACDYCVDKLKRYKFIFDVIDEYGTQGVAIVRANELVSKATAYEKEGNFFMVFKCLDKAIELIPNDIDILNKTGMLYYI